MNERPIPWRWAAGPGLGGKAEKEREDRVNYTPGYVNWPCVSGQLIGRLRAGTEMESVCVSFGACVCVGERMRRII